MIPNKPEDSTFHSKEHSDKRRSKNPRKNSTFLCQACRNTDVGKSGACKTENKLGESRLYNDLEQYIYRALVFSHLFSLRSDLSLGR